MILDSTAMRMNSIVLEKESLPCFQAKSEIIDAVKSNKTSVFIGETGSGKTTQIPQFLLDDGLAEQKCIAVTQPRRVAAISIARRVALERRSDVGNLIGYSVRFENCTSPSTRIKYLTDGMLLRESITDPLLQQYGIVILDEAHERTLCTDLLFGIVKKAQSDRGSHNPLKVIIMSATLEANRIAEFFNKAPSLKILGRNYSLEILNPTKTQVNYVQSALFTVFDIHQNQECGDILVFCTGQEEIDYMVSETKLIRLNLPTDQMKIEPLPLYASLPFDQQTLVFESLPQDTRKVIFATNIAETSITIPNIKYVIDTGKVKAKTFNPVSGFDVLNIQNISKAQAEQRMGRCGRDSPGRCYRLYTVEEHKDFRKHTIPEIMRCSLTSAILQIIALGIGNVFEFDFIDKPSNDNIKHAIKVLKALEAITNSENKFQLTEIGKKMVKFPLDPQFSKMIISSQKFKCTEEILSIVAVLSVDNVFHSTDTQREKFAKIREKFDASEGDHILLLNVYKFFRKFKADQEWCSENFINSRNMNKVISTRQQLSKICERNAIPLVSCGQNAAQIKKSLISGLFINVALLHDNNIYKMIEGKEKLKIHPASSLFSRKEKPECVIYTELVQTKEFYMRCVTDVSEEMLVSVMQNYFKDKRCRLAKVDIPNNYSFA